MALAYGELERRCVRSGNAVAGQEFILFSWRLVLCDAFIMLYILIITFYLLLLGSNLTTNVVTSALFT
jgi:hypothetical protein